MPYAVKRTYGDKPYKIIKIATGATVGSSKTKKDAEASIRARYLADNK